MKTLMSIKKGIETDIISINANRMYNKDNKEGDLTAKQSKDIATLDRELVKIDEKIKNYTKELSIKLGSEELKENRKNIRKFNNFKKLTLTKVLKSTSARDVVAITEFIKGLCQGLGIDKARMDKARIEVLVSFCKLQNDKLESKGILETLTERFENSWIYKNRVKLNINSSSSSTRVDVILGGLQKNEICN